MFKNLLFISLLALIVCSCKNEGCTNPYAVNYDAEAEEEDCTCVAYVDEMEGTFLITITSNPRQPSIEGDQFSTIVFKDHFGCNSETDEDFNFIKFNNLFTFFECDRYPLDKQTFTVSLSDNDTWAGAPVEGVGTIIDGTFHFEGTIYTSEGEFEIILDGTKSSDDRRTNAC
jgi:hypothetical protein